MQIFGKITELVEIKLRNASGFEVTWNADNLSKAVTFSLPDTALGVTSGVFVIADVAQTLTNKTIDADSNTITNIDNADIKAGAAIDASKIANGTVSSTEFQYLANVTSDIQTQLNTGASNLSSHLSDTVDAHDASAISVIAQNGISSTDAQAALEEVQGEITTHVNSLTAHTAANIVNVPSGNLAAITVQAALNELQSDVDSRATSADLGNHIGDSTDAHDASAISSVATGGLVATNVQAALQELDSELSGHVTDSSAAHVASAIGLSPVGSIAATDVQAAVQELDSDITTHTGASQNVHGVGAGNSVVGTGTSQALTNKTIDGDLNTIQDLAVTTLKTVAGKPHSVVMRDASGVATESFDHTGAIQLPDGTTAQRPANAAGLLRYNTDLGKFEGNNGSTWGEIGGGSAGINYITAKDFESYNVGATAGDWSNSGSITTTIASSELFGSKHLAVASSSAGAYTFIETSDVDPACVGEGVTVEVWTKGLSGYAPTAGTDCFQIVVNKVSGTGTGPLEYTRRNIPAGVYKYVLTFIPNEVAAYNIQIIKVGSTSQTIAVDQAFMGPKTTVLAPNMTDEIAYTPTITNITLGTGASSRWFYSQNADKLRINGAIKLGTGGSFSGVAKVSIPAQFAMDSSKMAGVNSSGGFDKVGTAHCYDASAATAQQVAVLRDDVSTTNVKFIASNGEINATVPFTWTVSDEIHVDFEVPVVGYSSNVQVVDRALERWYYNDSTWDSDDTSGASTKEGNSGGALGPTVAAALGAANRTKGILIPGLQPTDRVLLELKDDDNNGFTASFEGMDNANWGYNAEDTDSRGIGIQSINYTTGLVKVVLGKYSRKISGSNQNWPASSTGFRWRVSVISQGSLVGVGPLESRYIKGVTDGSAALSGMVGEVLSAAAAINVPASGVVFDAASLEITDGVWLVMSSAHLTRNGATFSAVDLESWLGLTAGGNNLEQQVGRNNGVQSLAASTSFSRISANPPSCLVEKQGATVKINGTAYTAGSTLRVKTYVGNYSSGTPVVNASIYATRIR